MSDNKRTAIDWLFLMINNPNDNQELALKCFKKAKEIEKEQIEDSYIMGSYDMAAKEFRPRQYYEETYGNEDDLSDWDVTLNDGLPDEE
jgi:hypothetical protein